MTDPIENVRRLIEVRVELLDCWVKIHSHDGRICDAQDAATQAAALRRELACVEKCVGAYERMLSALRECAKGSAFSKVQARDLLAELEAAE